MSPAAIPAVQAVARSVNPLAASYLSDVAMFWLQTVYISCLFRLQPLRIAMLQGLMLPQCMAACWSADALTPQCGLQHAAVCAGRFGITNTLCKFAALQVYQSLST